MRIPKLQVHMGSWIIQDGNYEDFSCGQTRDFALEFWHKDKLKSTSSAMSVSNTNSEDPFLEVTAEVIICNESWHAIDFGIRAYQETPPSDSVRLENKVHGNISLGIDPFMYRGYLHKEAEGFPMIYSWKIDRIRMLSAPLIKNTQHGKSNEFIRDPDKFGWEDINSTIAWTDDNGHAEYLLDVTLIDHEALG